MKRLKILSHLSMVALLFAYQGPKDLGQKETAIPPGANVETIQKKIPDFTNADGFLISGRLDDETIKVQDLTGKEGVGLRALEEKIFKEQGDETLKGYEFSREEEDLIAREPHPTCVVGGTYYDENGHKKLDPSQGDFKEAQEQRAENKAKDQIGFHGNAEADAAAIHKDLPEFSEDEAPTLAMRLNDYLEVRKDVQGLQGKDLSAFKEDLVGEKRDDLAKDFNYFSEDQINLILSHICLGCQVDGEEYVEQKNLISRSSILFLKISLSKLSFHFYLGRCITKENESYQGGVVYLSFSSIRIYPGKEPLVVARPLFP